MNTNPVPLAVAFCVAIATSNYSRADTITFFGDFADGFGPVPIAYSSSIPYEPGIFAPVFHEMVAGIPKFDPSLGTLTDITVFVDASSPIFYTLGGGMTVTEVDDSLPDYSASIMLFGDIMLNYESTSLASMILSEVIPLEGMGIGAAGTGGFTTPVGTPADGSLIGAASVFGSVDLADFVGPGLVDTLFIDLIVEDTADFMVDNSTATASLAFDVFDSDSGVDDAVIGVTYTFTPIPEPNTAGLFVCAASLFTLARRRRKT